jgi:hypothetical protein
MPNNSAVQAEIDERRAALLKLRRENPAMRFHDPRILALGYSSDGHARKDFQRLLEIRRKDLDAEVTAFREEQNEVLESLLAVYVPQALGLKGEPDIKASELVLKLLERQAKLNGWEAALKAELSGPGGGAVPIRAATINELRDLIHTAGDPDDGDDDLDSTPAEDPDDDDDGDDT